MTDYIHSLGLKAGIYTSPGTTTCAGHVGAYQYEKQTIQRFVDWGFDFLKYDWCSYGKIAPNDSMVELQKPYIFINEILKKQNRDIILNLCQYGMGDVWKWGKSVGGHSWRTAGDLGGWMRPIEDGSIAVGLFNRGEKETRMTALWSDLGISGPRKVRDLWRQKDIGSFNEKFSVKVGRHGVVLIRLQ